MAYDIGPKIGIEGEAQFRAELKTVSQTIRTLGSEMEAVTSAFTGNEKSMAGLTSQQKILREQISAVYDKIKIQEAAVEKSSEAFGENATETMQWRQALAKSKTEMNKLQSQLDSVEGDMDDFGKETKKAGENLDKAGESGLKFGDIIKANVISDAITSGIKKLGSAIADLGREMAEFAKSGIETASDLDEVQNVVDTTFGSSGAAAIEEFAKSAATSFGMSELSAKQFTGTMGAMLKSMGLTEDEVLSMSTDLTGLAGDIASFYNLDPEEAFSKLRSGISGETEPLKQLGINMSVANLEAYALAWGISTAYSEMSQAEQATLRYNYLMQATADAQGDFAKTSDSYANQQRIMELNMENLSATIGGALLPYMTELTAALNGLLSGETDISGFVSAIGGLVTRAGEAIITNLPILLNAGGQMLSSLLEGISEMLPSIAETCSVLLTELMGGLETGLPLLLELGMEMLTTLLNAFADALPGLVPVAVNTVLAMIERLTDPEVLVALLDAGLALILGLGDGLIAAIPDLVAAIPTIVENLVTGIVDFLPDFLATGVDLILGLAGGLIQAIPDLVMAIPQIIEALLNGIIEAVPALFEAGVDLIEGLWEGIASMGVWLWEQVSGFFDDIVGGIKDFLGIHSPSKVFAGIGGFMAEGLGEGFEDTMAGISSRMQKSIPTPTMEIRAALNGVADSIQSGLLRSQGASQPTHFDLSINLDGQTLARRMYTYNQRENELRGGALAGGLA